MINSQNSLGWALLFFCCALLPACSGDSGDANELEYCDVEPLFAEHCIKCHYAGENAQGPMALETYEQVFKNKGIIPDWVKVRMPSQDPKYPVTITQEERDVIVEWAQGPAVEGDCK